MIAVSATAEDRLSELRALRHRLIAKLQRWPEERLHFQPASDGWCVLQMLDHILLTEEAFRSRCGSACRRRSASPRGIGSAA